MDKLANISVNIAQMKISKPPDVLVAMGLGSCIGVALYDPLLKIGGMLHVLLPVADAMDKDAKRTKFANPGIYDFVEAMVNSSRQGLPEADADLPAYFCPPLRSVQYLYLFH